MAFLDALLVLILPFKASADDTNSRTWRGTTLRNSNDSALAAAGKTIGDDTNFWRGTTFRTADEAFTVAGETNFLRSIFFRTIFLRIFICFGATFL